MYDEFLTKKSSDPVKWCGTLMFAVASIIISGFPDLASDAWPFMLFFLGHVLWISAGYYMKDKAVLFLNLMYVPIDIYAIAVRFH